MIKEVVSAYEDLVSNDGPKIAKKCVRELVKRNIDELSHKPLRIEQHRIDEMIDSLHLFTNNRDLLRFLEPHFGIELNNLERFFVLTYMKHTSWGSYRSPRSHGIPIITVSNKKNAAKVLNHEAQHMADDLVELFSNTDSENGEVASPHRGIKYTNLSLLSKLIRWSSLVPLAVSYATINGYNQPQNATIVTCMGVIITTVSILERQFGNMYYNQNHEIRARRSEQDPANEQT